MKIKLDLDLCQGHSVCVDECPEVFKVEDVGADYPKVVLLTDSPDESLRDRVRAAAKYCPNKVITIEG
jgi:sterol 14-demethylase